MNNAEAPADYRDRKVGLIVFGILQILIGGVCALMVPLMVVGLCASAAAGSCGTYGCGSVQMAIAAAAIYVSLAVWFIWMGVGSILARRWARALVLVASWIWFVCGLGGLLYWCLVMPDMYAQMAQSGKITPNVAFIVKTVTTAFLIVVYIILPGLLILFYGSRHVKATCEHRDPQHRWTDKCPLPVLAVSLLFWLGSPSILLMLCYGSVFPIFGILLSGAAGTMMIVLVALLLGFLAWGVYRMRVAAWWGAVVVTVAGSVSGILTFSRVGLVELYEAMGFPEEQIETITQYATYDSAHMVLYTGLWVVVALGYLLYIRRYFLTGSSQMTAGRK